MNPTDLITQLRRTTLAQATYEAIEEIVSRVNAGGKPPADLLRAVVVRRLIYHARRLTGCDPRRAVVVSLAAAELVSHMDVGLQTLEWSRVNSALVRLEANAWMEHALALLKAGDYMPAQKASLLAHRFFTFYEALGKSLVVTKTDAEANELKLIHGQIIFHLGDADKGLRLIDEAADYLLLVLDKKKKYVRARTIHATLLMRQDRFDEALDMLEEAAELAEEAGDSETPAYILNNIAFCAANLGDFERAQKCCETALTMFSDLGLTAELPRLRGSLVEILKARRRFNEAISELYKTRAEYLALRMPVIAATFSTDIVELLLAANRRSEVPALCAEMISTFSRAGLKKEALRALASLDECSARDVLTNDAISHAKRFLERFRLDDSIVFTPLEHRPVA